MPRATPPSAGDARIRLGDSKLIRGLSLLQAFRFGERELTLTQLTLRSGLSKGSAHRLTWELAQLGMLERVATGFRPGPAFARIVLRATTWPALVAAAGPATEGLAHLTGLPVTLYCTSGSGLVPVSQTRRRGDVVEHRPVPPVRPDASAVLPALRARLGPLRVGSTVMAPIRSANGEVVAALRVADTHGWLHRVEPLVANAASRTEIDLHWAAEANKPSVEAAQIIAAGARSSDPTTSVLARGMDLLGCLRPGERSVRRVDVVTRVTTPRSTVYRCLGDLQSSGVLEGDAARQLGFGPLVRRLAAPAVAAHAPAHSAIHRLVAELDVDCWLTPVDVEFGTPLNGLVVRAPTGATRTVRHRLAEWSLVAASAANAVPGGPAPNVRHLALASSADGRVATTVLLPRGALCTGLTIVAERSRFSGIEDSLTTVAERAALSA